MLLKITAVVMRAADLIAGCYFFCTRAAFDSAGGFDERVYAGEELVLSRRLARIGPIAILDAPVVTSGRKMRQHSGWELVRLVGAFVRRGPGILRNRDDLAIWYGKRRNDGDRDE